MEQSFRFRIGSSPQPKLAFTNRIYVSRNAFNTLGVVAKQLGVKIHKSDPAVNITIGPWIFLASPHDEVAEDDLLGLNQLQRKCGSYQLNQVVTVTVFEAGTNVALTGMTVGLDLIVKKAGTPRLSLDADELSTVFKTTFANQVFSLRQQLAFDFNGYKLELFIDDLDHADFGGEESDNVKAATKKYGQVNVSATQITWRKATGSQTNIVFTGSQLSATNDSLFKGDFKFEKMGIGGLGVQFETMFRRAFASRIFPGLVKELGINHVRGILLFGPPGCGKTLIARKIGQVLNAREPKIVNGPEILDKYVGGSEEKVRALFADAEKEQAEMGDQSMLHIIIFDEMDAVMKARGSGRDSTGTTDSVVNQLLSKIDGVDSLNNILIIGMTNRKDMIDEAILRPGRLELHIEVALPDAEGTLNLIYPFNTHIYTLNQTT